ncbi:MAG: glycoside hydrolase family 97 N-terminal domain-containing protein [Caldilineaceae bacterium]
MQIAKTICITGKPHQWLEQLVGWPAWGVQFGRSKQNRAIIRGIMLLIGGWLSVMWLGHFTATPLAAAPRERTPARNLQQQTPPEATVWLPIGFHAYHPATIQSPDGKLRLTFFLGTTPTEPTLAYAVAYNGQPLLQPSALDLRLAATEAPLGPFALTGLHFATVDQSTPMILGETATLRDHYQAMTVSLREMAAPQRELVLHFRAYDTGVALRYVIPAQPNWSTVTITDEQTHFAFPADHQAYVQVGMEGLYQRQPLSAITSRSENPLTIVQEDGLFTAITEAHVDNYPRMTLARSAETVPTLVTVLAGNAASTTLPYQTPWRVVLVAPSATALLAHNHLVYLLSPPSALLDTSWIQPGKAMRIMGLNTAAALAVIDFATAHNIAYVEFDAGWYGFGVQGEFDPVLDATQPIAAIDMPQVLAHAAQTGRGVLLYVNRVALEQQLDQILAQYAAWGVQGIKLGFMDGETQAGINLIHQIVQKAADYHLVVDVHDSYRPSGMSRTYPNLLTQEGLRGNEHFSGADHTVILPYTRFLIGAGDHTFPYYNDLLNVTRAQQLAAMIAFFSPLQFVFWYDSPSDYQGEAEIALIEALPTVWDETQVLDAQIGSYLVTARRKGAEWFVGALTNTEARTVTIPLTFLAPTQSYTAYSYRDHTPIVVASATATVTNSDTITASLLPSGGYAVQFVPVANGQ